MSSESIAESFRRWGYLQADLDVLGRLPSKPHRILDAHPDSPWRKIYCGTMGVEFMHLPDPDRISFIQERMEEEAPKLDKEFLCDRLLRADLFEKALQIRHVGTKRFSLEGLTAFIPFLDEVMETAASHGAKQVMLGMSHRGRLNAMVNVVGRSPEEVFAQFEDVDPRSVLGGGDVRYHVGAGGDYQPRKGERIRVVLPSNPSHLEAIGPVLLGRVRARQDRLGRGVILPILAHGDAALAGQGIASETFNLSSLAGYSVGGTLHVVLNNLVGFTTVPEHLHSGRFASDIAKRVPVPIIHVNAEDPEAVVRAARIAAEYRFTFSSDVVVDLIGYRRHGHSEVEDPTTSQPMVYRKVRALPWLSDAYGKSAGIDLGPRTEEIRSEFRAALDRARDLARRPALRSLPGWWDAYRGGKRNSDERVDTRISRSQATELGGRLSRLPDGFSVHPKLEKFLGDRHAMAKGDKPFDWGGAEGLALASLLDEGVPVRLTGQDSRRGTFNQRHAALFDQETGEEFAPLSKIGEKSAPFSCYDSPLSEAAPLAFEYGYGRDYPDALVIWEAQFGDFANGAQVILDQFLSAGEDKWGLLSGVVVLLPHGYDGQGPEHSSGRLERFLQLSAEDNWQVCQPTTAAQYFHLLRRQALTQWRKPLIVFTPKSLLRAPAASSDLTEIAEGSFQPLLAVGERNAERLLICTGKIGHELVRERERRGDSSTAILRLEELYPFPEESLKAVLSTYGKCTKWIWVQEEPGNMGALEFVRPRLEGLLGDRQLLAIRRSPSASPATGSSKAHGIEQKALLDLAFSGEKGECIGSAQ